MKEFLRYAVHLTSSVQFSAREFRDLVRNMKPIKFSMLFNLMISKVPKRSQSIHACFEKPYN